MPLPPTASRLDRRIQLQAPNATRDATFGAVQPGFTTVATVWAKRVEATGGTGTSAEQRVGSRSAQHLIRYRNDVQAGWRIVDGTRRFRIVGMPAEVGHRQGLLIDSEETTDA